MRNFIEVTSTTNDTRKIHINSLLITAIFDYGDFRSIELMNGSRFPVIETYKEICGLTEKASHFKIENFNL